MTNNQHGQVPAIQRYKIGYHSDEWGVRSLSPTDIYDDAGTWVRYEDHAAEFRRLHAENQALRAAHVQKPAGIEHVAGDVSKNGAESNMSTQQEAQEPCPTCAALARTVMLDQVRFDRKPDCYGIRQITDDEGVEEWEDIRTSPDVAREEANDMMATGRGEIYEVVPLWTTPQPFPTAKAADSVREDAARYRYLRDVPMDEWPDELATAFRLQQNAIWDAAIDAAMKVGGAR